MAMRYPPPLLSLSAIVAGTSTRSAEEYNVGDYVVVTSAQNLQTESGELMRDRGYVFPGVTLRVGEVKGERLLLSNGVPGWLDAAHIIPFHAAADYFTKAIKCDPEDPDLLFARGAVHMDAGAFDLAIDDFNDLIKLNAECAGTWLLRGQVQYCRGELDLAMNDFNESLRLNPTDPNTYACIGNVWRAKGYHDSAIQNYDAAIEIDPQFVTGLICRAQCFLDRGDLDKAIAELDTAIGLDPLAVGAFDNRAYAFHVQGQHHRAIADYDEVIRLDPKYARAYANRAAIWIHLREFSKAIVDYDLALGIDPRNADAYTSRGDLRWKQGDYENAIADFTEAFQLEWWNPARIQTLAWIWATCPDESYRNALEAVKYANRACELTNFDDWLSVNSLAAAYAEAGDFERAVTLAKNSLELCPEAEKAEVREHLACYEAGKPFRDNPRVKKP